LEPAIDPAVVPKGAGSRAGARIGERRGGLSMNIFYIYQLIILNFSLTPLDYHVLRPTSQQRKPR